MCREAVAATGAGTEAAAGQGGRHLRLGSGAPTAGDVHVKTTCVVRFGSDAAGFIRARDVKTRGSPIRASSMSDGWGSGKSSSGDVGSSRVSAALG